MNNKIFVSYKPPFLSSNHFLSRIKRRYNAKKAGFSGTLDPFAKGVLIVAFGQYTKLFRFLKKSPKRYRATLWLGAYSETLDIEKISSIHKINPLKQNQIVDALNNLLGDITYLPPKYSAKKIDGKRAYQLSRKDKEFELKSITSTIYDIDFINYCHPFVTFDIEVSEGSYIRSIAHILAKKLNTTGVLSSLQRLCEGDFIYQNEKPLDITKFINLKENSYLGDIDDILLGKVLYKEDFMIKEDGEYLLNLKEFISIITIKDGKVVYTLNRIKLC